MWEPTLNPHRDSARSATAWEQKYWCVQQAKPALLTEGGFAEDERPTKRQSLPFVLLNEYITTSGTTPCYITPEQTKRNASLLTSRWCNNRRSTSAHTWIGLHTSNAAWHLSMLTTTQPHVSSAGVDANILSSLASLLSSRWCNHLPATSRKTSNIFSFFSRIHFMPSHQPLMQQPAIHSHEFHRVKHTMFNREIITGNFALRIEYCKHFNHA